MFEKRRGLLVYGPDRDLSRGAGLVEINWAADLSCGRAHRLSGRLPRCFEGEDAREAIARSRAAASKGDGVGSNRLFRVATG